MAAFFRQMSKSTIGTIITVVFLVGILASFALQDMQTAGAGSFGFSSSSGSLVSVGNQGVTERDMSAAMQRRLAEARQQNPEADYTSLAGEFANILESLVSDACEVS
jgi:hypothetical protein